MNSTLVKVQLELPRRISLELCENIIKISCKVLITEFINTLTWHYMFMNKMVNHFNTMYKGALDARDNMLTHVRFKCETKTMQDDVG